MKMGKDFNNFRHFIFICNGSDCKARGAKEITSELKDILEEEGLDSITKIIKTKCTSRCKEAPVLILKEKWLTEISRKDLKEIVKKYIKEKE
jgi:NADH:ubiquinone oxidoreductase subunit E